MPIFTLTWEEHKTFTGEFADDAAARQWWQDMDLDDLANYDGVEYYDFVVGEHSGDENDGHMPDINDLVDYGVSG